MRWMHGIQDVRFPQSWSSSSQQLRPIVRRVCIREFRTVSSPIQAPGWKWPMSSHESSSTLSNSVSIRNTIFFVSSFSPISVIVHWHEDDPSLEVLRFTLWFSRHLLNLLENSQCCESWEIFQLEFHQFPVDPIQFSNSRDSMNHLILLSHALTGSRLMPPRHSGKSEKT